MLKRVVFIHMLWLFVFLGFSIQALSQSMQNVTPSSNIQDVSQIDYSPLMHLGSEYQNGIKLLQNRFRIDYEVNEITMVFFRQFGSAPVVLVQPDGSKIFQSNADGENIFWVDTSTYDMIRIKNPMPGPWQAVGKINSESRVMVLSDLTLHADSLPKILFSGEILKHTAYLTNNGIPIDYAEFRDVVELTISLSSTNNPDSNNFGANNKVVATFEDNGKGMDERPLDGIYTGQFNLTISDGEWVPTFNVSTPMYTREQVDPKIMLLANPIKINVEVDNVINGIHILKVDAQREYVDISTLLIDGKVRFPNGDIQNFSITDMSAQVREYLIVNYEYGVYRVKLTAYGNTIDGREFILDVPEYSFLSETPEVIVIPDEPNTVSAAQTDNIMIEATISEADEKISTSSLVSFIVGINLFILIVGGGLIWWLTLGNKNSFISHKNLNVTAIKKMLTKK